MVKSTLDWAVESVVSPARFNTEGSNVATGVAVRGASNTGVPITLGAGGREKMRTTPIWMKSRSAARAGGTRVNVKVKIKIAMSAPAQRPRRKRARAGRVNCAMTLAANCGVGG